MNYSNKYYAFVMTSMVTAFIGMVMYLKNKLWCIQTYYEEKVKNIHPLVRKIFNFITKPEVQIALILSYKLYNSSKTKYILNGLKMVKGIIIEEIHASFYDFVTSLF